MDPIYRRSFIRIVLLALFLGIFFWILDGLINYLFFDNLLRRMIFERPSSVIDSLFFNMSLYSLFIRTAFLIASLIAGVLVGIYFVRQKRVEQELIKHQSELENIVEKRTRELTETNKELENFAFVTSHDLQEPLRMISSYLQLLKKRYGGSLDEDADEFIEYAVDGSKRMQTIINDLLTFSRLGREALNLEEYESRESLDMAIANLGRYIEEAKADIQIGDMPVIFADKKLILHIFQNLIINSIKFSKKDTTPKIIISSYKDGGNSVFSVKDNGIGIEKQYQEKIFNIFTKLHSNKEYKGTGIGLGICKRIVELHNGRMWVDSEKGEGATFFFSIPGP
ncbi:MAG TPA: ATP-binding protein [Candidatus Methanofastidiosa archaeon]|nr:ATP-binding protein [Candidatus Methanofastidiosa archaeon]